MVRRKPDRRKYAEKLFVHFPGEAHGPKARTTSGFEHVRRNKTTLGDVEIKISGIDRRSYKGRRQEDKRLYLKKVKSLIGKKGLENVTRHDIAAAVKKAKNSQSKKPVRKK